MKKYWLVFLVFCVCVLTACTKADKYSSFYYKRLCQKENQSACAKYLFLQSWEFARQDSYTTNIDKQNWNYWKERYLNKLETVEDAYVAIESTLSSLDDPYTRFLTPEELEDQAMNISAELTGIGVVMSSRSGKITIEDVLEDTPAFDCGLKIGDVILKVDDVSVSGLDIRAVAKMVRGPIDTKLKLLVLRGKKDFEKEIVRKKISIKSVSHKMLPDNIAYIRISTFMSQSTSAELVKALEATSGAKSLIIDLRGNQGGLLQNAIFISNMFLQKGDVVKILQKNNKKEVVRVKPANPQITRPIVVLINGFTASAGEILAAALQENGRAVLVGETTFGKGLIQKIVPLPLNTAMNITIAKYLTPQNHDINKNGIKPDYEVKYTQEDFKKGNDVQLNKAVELLKEK